MRKEEFRKEHREPNKINALRSLRLSCFFEFLEPPYKRHRYPDTLWYFVQSDADDNSQPAEYPFVIREDGKVFIGTMGNSGTHSDALLQVGGKILAHSYKATMSSWSDYVFKKDYKMLSLLELEAYINKYGYMPGMPSEKEIIENGLDLPEMAKMQQVKIEENTLYDIEQQKEIEQLKKENKELKKDVKRLEKKFERYCKNK